MRKFLTAVAGLVFATSAYAACTTQTIILPSGKMMVCTTCCYGSNCTTSCI